MRGLRTMGMSAMFVVDMAGVIMLRMRMSNGLYRSVVVMVMSVITMIVRVMSMTMVKRCRVRQRRRKQWSGSAVS